ncbi:hypothetical protein [Rossellomorea yichunensis]|uniref:hypothetical protein n=1 Tax=Rossellomorea yichunensis TaxID=3077331 RepID=UPI0028DE4420|nr:hypothetical protein [Rossellomorea sp. YC4-1]MDT9027885.1 hypothetical protein [Rossellomorea sp. YC4-1]
MKREKDLNFSVPASIQILFNNQKLEIMKILCLLNALSTQNNKQRKVEELLFYYSLVNFDLIDLFNSVPDNNDKFPPSPNQYFRFQTKINEILILMSHFQFIEIRGKLSDKQENLKVKLLIQGKKFYEDNSSDYLNSLFEEYVKLYKTIAYTTENVKKVKEGTN